MAVAVGERSRSLRRSIAANSEVSLSVSRWGFAVSVAVVCASLATGISAWAKPGYAPLSSFAPPNGFSEPVGLGVDNSMSLDKGDVYVSDRGTDEVDQFSTSGTLLKQTSLPGARLDGLTVDSSPGLSEGDVYVVGYESGVVYRLAPGLGSTEELVKGLDQPTDVAVDQAGDIFVAELGGNTGGPRVLEFNSFGKPIDPNGTVVGAGENVIVSGLLVSWSVGVDPAGTHLYVGTETYGVYQYTLSGNEYVEAATRLETKSGGGGSEVVGGIIVAPSGYVDIVQRGYETFSVAEYEPSGALVTESGHGTLSYDASGLGINGESGELYVVDWYDKVVFTFEAGELPAVPVTEQNGQVQGSKVLLNGSLKGGETEYHFDWDTGSRCVENTANKESYYTRETTPAAASGSQEVHAELTNLNPDTVYNYCLVATNRYGSELGSEVSFETGAVEPKVSNVEAVPGTDSATISAQIDPEDETTNYYVEYGKGVPYEFKTAVTLVGSGGSPVAVSSVVKGLNGNTEYHYRVVASNAVGVTESADATFSTYAALTSGLPDGRVYEMVTPVESHGAEAYGPGIDVLYGEIINTVAQAAADGDAIAYAATAGTGGNGIDGLSRGNQYVAKRGPSGGWTQTNVVPLGDVTAEYQAFSPDLTVGIFTSSDQNESKYSIPYLDELDGGFTPFFTSAPLHRLGGVGAIGGHTSFTSIDFGAFVGGGGSSAPVFAGASVDFSDLLFEANDDLLSGNGSVEKQLDEITEAEVSQLLLLVREGEQLSLELSELESAEGTNSPSVEAKHAELEVKGQEVGAIESADDRNELYMSAGGSLSLVNILPGGKVAPGAVFGGEQAGVVEGFNFSHVISSDGSRVFWSNWDGQGAEAHRIFVREKGTKTVPVSQSTARYWTATPDGRYVYYTENGVLWRFDVEKETRKQLSAGNGVVGVLGVNETGEDGKYLYFVTGEVLGNEQNAGGQKPVEGERNLYVMGSSGVNSEPSTIRYIATLGAGAIDSTTWSLVLHGRTAMVAPDGESLVFSSYSNLTGEPTPDGGPNVYVFSARDDSLFCASCRPQGSGASLPASESSLLSSPRWISDDGNRVFFDSSAPLVWQDINGGSDVYEWERHDNGGCSEPSGCVRLLSNGREGPAGLIDASASGNDVFMVTRQRLSPLDVNENVDVYDARVDGVEPVTPPLCSGTGCQGVPSPPLVFATPASVTFAGVGNFAGSSTANKGTVTKSKPKPLTRAQKLTRGLRKCRAIRSKRKRRGCEANVRKKYGKTAQRHGRSSSTAKRGGE